jgi:hypothetical protein
MNGVFAVGSNNAVAVEKMAEFAFLVVHLKLARSTDPSARELAASAVFAS